ncbi:very short patch repair endonuclease [Microbulbifer magnicolonia]|uniref:very short patch repair endonuclease n=1 Tax=Microbulbifer magnicolonia TaxID=3109744 RepID=UPI003BF49254
MTDILSRKERSHRMSLIKGKNTKPELEVRRLIHRMGYRYRLHRGDLPGRPDIVFGRKRKVIFVNGCFWHGHRGCKKARFPKSRCAYWRSKIEGNKSRDAINKRKLKALGWDYLVIWECELKYLDLVQKRIVAFLK